MHGLQAGYWHLRIQFYYMHDSDICNTWMNAMARPQLIMLSSMLLNIAQKLPHYAQ